MKVINLVSWAGDRFSVAPNACIELPDKIAKARIDADLAKKAGTNDKPVLNLTDDLLNLPKPQLKEETAETADARETGVAEDRETREGSDAAKEGA